MNQTTGRQQADEQQVSLKWLDSASATGLITGVTWGVPWHRGQLARHEQLELRNEQGELLQVQSWPTAYWPDGSVKWTAHAAELANTGRERYVLSKVNQPPLVIKQPKLQQQLEYQQSTQPHQEEAAIPGTRSNDLFVTDEGDLIKVNGEAVVCHIRKSGSILIDSLSLRGQEDAPIAEQGKLKLILSDAPGRHDGNRQTYVSEIEQVSIESAGPLRAVIAIKGCHRLEAAVAERTANGTYEQLIPFTVRLTFYRHQATIRLKHTLLYDGDPALHAIAGIGISFNVPMKGALENRHIRFAGDMGWFSEAARGLMTARFPAFMEQKYRDQLKGKLVSWDPANEREQQYASLLEDAAVWNDFKLVQLNPDSYSISKRTSEGCAWVRSLYGARARGLLYVGSEAGGIALAMKHFWQLCPSGMEVSGLGRDLAEATLWLWSPEAAAMDLRHYDTTTHVRSSYEGADELRSTPYGIGHTTECQLHLAANTPQQEELEQLARGCEYTPLLVCKEERYVATLVFGRYSLPQYDTERHRQTEEALESIWRFYLQEIEQRRWYGFWDYGDVMHSYDPLRHTWKYDIGGCAWQNTELVPNKWLWYSFLRTGEPQLFYMAEAMTRHTSETDLYHLGQYQGLGSRHNVLHYGCGCKEARIGMATLHRFYYYMTADERIGEIMDEVKDADFSTVTLDPMRAYFPKDEHATHARSGPDWSAFCANWLVQWERHESEHYLHKIKTGIDSLKQSPHRLLDGPTFGYDPETGKLSYMGHENYDYHLMICMGGTQVWTELADLLEDETWREMLAELGEFYNLPPAEKSKRTKEAFVGKRWDIPMLSTLIMAYAAEYYSDDALGNQAWDYLLTITNHWQLSQLQPQQVERLYYPYPVSEVQGLSTNTASQWSLNVIMCKAYIGHLL
ncbi:exo-rhamnogalacturonan lyase family protein [Paenibacillus sp. FSL W7-1287]|uniref:exo-rhamnogalacturonan lyase family protein n=1 Tax=Paenibacillus sp. FSL W7-1287 TaxID=2954538 RepID=UPI0030FBFA39